MPVEDGGGSVPGQVAEAGGQREATVDVGVVRLVVCGNKIIIFASTLILP